MKKTYSNSTIVWFFIILIFIVAGGVLLFPVYKNLRSKQQELRVEQKRLAEKKAELFEKQKQISDLENSPQAVERYARENLKMVRKGESVMYIDKKDRERIQKSIKN